MKNQEKRDRYLEMCEAAGVPTGSATTSAHYAAGYFYGSDKDPIFHPEHMASFGSSRLDEAWAMGWHDAQGDLKKGKE